ncbi:hypothetical protein M2266_005598 [Streptomyces sp. SPB162]|nr:hypothetical protein [Streptomyces sp. SPB162]
MLGDKGCDSNAHHDAFVSLACSLICYRRLKNARS